MTMKNFLRQIVISICLGIGFAIGQALVRVLS